MAEIGLKDFTVSSALGLREVEDCLRRWGAAVVPAWLSSEEVSLLNSDWEAIRALRHRDDVPYVHHVGGSVADYAALYRSVPGGNQFPAIERVFGDKLLAGLADKIVGAPYLLNEEVYATFDQGTGAEVAPSHFDKAWNLKFMVYLHDIMEPDSGAFGIHPGSHVIGRKQFRTWFSKNTAGNAVKVGAGGFHEMGNDHLPEGLNDCVEILAPAGTLIIFSTDVFHRASRLAEGRTRRILRAHCCPGYQLPIPGDIWRKSGRQWIRGEHEYARLSVDGYLEFRDFFVRKLLPGWRRNSTPKPRGPYATALAMAANPRKWPELTGKVVNRIARRR